MKTDKKKSAVTPATTDSPAAATESSAVRAVPSTKAAAKQRVRIKIPAGANLATPASPAAPRAARAPRSAVVTAATELPRAKPAKPAAPRATKPAALRQRIKVTKPRAAKPAVAVPPVLLEGDEPSRATTPGGPGARYALGPSAPPAHAARLDEPGELPDSYGTRRLLLAARDPHWLYAHWDFTREQLRRFNGLSADGHLILRVFVERVAGEPFVTQHVHPESKCWFVFVGRGATRFVAELGYRDAAGAWNSLSVSRPALTPPDAISDDTSVTFANLPAGVPFDQILDVVKAAVSDNVPLLEALRQLDVEGRAPFAASVFEAAADKRATAPRWTPEQERALAALVTMDEIRRVWIGSLEITELVKRQLARELSSAAAAQFSEGSSSPHGGVSSFAPNQAAPARNFWFNINAELVIYGATDPSASVAIGGRRIKLRPDGTFSYRFALPDGQFELPVTATSADEAESRSADLHFSRVTHYEGDVGAHAQDSALQSPGAESVA